MENRPLVLHGFQIAEHDQLGDGGLVAHVALRIGMRVAPLPGGHAKEGDVDDVRLIRVYKADLLRGKARVDQVLLHGVGVKAVVGLCDQALGPPFKALLVRFVGFEPLVILYNVELEFGGKPGGKFECNVGVGKGAAIAPGARNDSNGVCMRYLFFG